MSDQEPNRSEKRLQDIERRIAGGRDDAQTVPRRFAGGNGAILVAATNWCRSDGQRSLGCATAGRNITAVLVLMFFLEAGRANVRMMRDAWPRVI